MIAVLIDRKGRFQGRGVPAGTVVIKSLDELAGPELKPRAWE